MMSTLDTQLSYLEVTHQGILDKRELGALRQDDELERAWREREAARADARRLRTGIRNALILSALALIVLVGILVITRGVQ